jgi:hypothetical protein
MSDRFYGIYRGICVDNADPQKLDRITLIVPQILGQIVTDWALPCTPITNTAEHLDHQPHTGPQVVALINNHTATTDSAGTGLAAHTHTVTISAHSGNSNTLKHPHVTMTDPLDRDGTEEGLVAAEHTYHRHVPAVGQSVWLMFVGGDPNFPVWMGV